MLTDYIYIKEKKSLITLRAGAVCLMDVIGKPSARGVCFIMGNMCGKAKDIDYNKVFSDVFPILQRGYVVLNDALSMVGAGVKRDAFYAHLSDDQRLAVKTLIEKNKREHHKTGRTYLGKMCRLGHEYENTGKGLRYISNSMCVICHREGERINGIIPDLRKPTREIATEYPFNEKVHYLGRICKHNHKYHGHNYSLRYKSNKVCVKCHTHNLHLEDGAKRLNASMSHGIYKSLKNNKGGHSWQVMVGYSLQELKAHLEGMFDLFMNWDNYGRYWHVDHIVPRSYFKFYSHNDPEFAICWSLSNLRPLESCANLKKGNKMKRKYGNLPSQRLR